MRGCPQHTALPCMHVLLPGPTPPAAASLVPLAVPSASREAMKQQLMHAWCPHIPLGIEVHFNHHLHPYTDVSQYVVRKSVFGPIPKAKSFPRLWGAPATCQASALFPPRQLLQDSSTGQAVVGNLPAAKPATAFCYPARKVLDLGAVSTLLRPEANEMGACGLAGHLLAQRPQGLTDLHSRHVCRGAYLAHWFIFSSLGCSASPVSFLIIPSSKSQPLPRAPTSPCQELLPPGQASICWQDGM